MEVSLPRSKFLIMGTQRSGTTLLSKALSSHPSIFVQNEALLPRLFQKAAIDANGLEGGLESFLLGKLNGEDAHAKWLLGLKDPLLTYHLDKVRQVLTFGKIIIIVRDPRGVVNSYMENAWGLGTNVYTGSLRWRHEIEVQLGLLEEYGPERIMLLKYEDLVDDLEGNLKRVVDFLGVRFDGAMLEYHKNNRYIPKARESRNTSSQPDTGLSSKWRQKLSHKQIRIIETLCSDRMHQLNYQREQSDIHIGAVETFYYRLHQRILGEIQLQYRLRKSRLRDRRRKQIGNGATQSRSA